MTRTEYARELVREGILKIVRDKDYLHIEVNGGCVAVRRVDAGEWERCCFRDTLETVVDTIRVMR